MARNAQLESFCPADETFRFGMIAAGASAFVSALKGAAQWASEQVSAQPGRLVTSSDFE
jgi:hypothetical protein